MIRTQISMTEQQQEALRTLASLRQVSQAAIFREALDTILGHELRAVRIERIRSSMGSFRSEPSNTSEAHDEALVDAFA